MTRQQPRPTLFPYTTLFRSAWPPLIAKMTGSGRGAITERHITASPTRASTHAILVSQRTDQCSTFERRRSEEHTSELQSRRELVFRLLQEKKKVLNCASVMR